MEHAGVEVDGHGEGLFDDVGEQGFAAGGERAQGDGGEGESLELLDLLGAVAGAGDAEDFGELVAIGFGDEGAGVVDEVIEAATLGAFGWEQGALILAIITLYFTRDYK